jgi:hypothetical protein
MPSIPAGNPTVVPDPGVITYNQWWIKRFGVDASQGIPAPIVAIFCKCYIDGQGVPHFSPLPTDTVRYRLPDLFAAMAADTTPPPGDLTTIYDSVVAKLVSLATTAGVIS